ncbi:CoA transferase [Aeromicrobium camelliae]|uniref:CoA transferase n=1 Tax=Aeromicrobium camelliae TaxID=1538144 RepID=A0A3N6X3I3_9ACTN|nr:CoA transferase [Aeromicrobium camelliae]RQN08193.1 CoA transferase [Aeromicrobium camelliae]
MSAGGTVSRRWGAVACAAAEALDIDLATLPLVETSGCGPGWRSRLAVGELAVDSVAFASAAIASVRGTHQTPSLVVDPRRVEASFGSDKLLRIGGEHPPIWAPLSGFWESADGWVRTHANYPHHQERLLRLLGLSGSPDRDAVAAAIARWDAADLEDAAARAGAVVAAVRDPATWAAGAQARALASAPLVESACLGVSGPRPWAQDSRMPLAGVRVLDLTRVIAGPVATRDLAYAGTEVLRVDSPRLPEPEWQHLDTGQGKRSTLLDLRQRSDRAFFDALLEGADVLVTGYRPGALERLGLSGPELASRHPGLVVGRISAWGHVGPWALRRGFDSIVQAATGIAWEEGDVAGGVLRRPGALPVQALDHGAGHLLAGALAVAVRRQREEGRTFEVGVALARLGQELLGHERSPLQRDSAKPGELPTTTMNIAREDGTRQQVTVAPPALAVSGPAGEWRCRPHGRDVARWQTPGGQG